MRLDNLTRDDIRALQERLGSLGFDPGRYDGVWGPRTSAAYDAYLATRERPVMAVTPPVAKPWWQSRRIIGAGVAVLAGLASAFTGVAVDAGETTELVMQAISLIGAIVAWYGSIKGTQPIDPDLVLPGVRLNRGLLRPDRSGAPRAVPTDDDDDGAGYWGRPRGPFSPE
jgi:hypothetical protein